MDKVYPSDPIVVISTGKDRGLVSLLKWFDPLHAMWNRTNDGLVLVTASGKIHTVH